MMDYDPDPHNRTQCHQGICRDKNPITQNITVNRKAERSCQLTDEQPLGDASACSSCPLLVDLLSNSEQKYHGGSPADKLCRQGYYSEVVAGVAPQQLN